MNNRNEQLLTAALAYAALGRRVLPVHSWAGTGCSCRKQDCHKPAKHPRINDWVNRASNDEATIKDWWEEFPGSNIGIATGGDLLVLDVDDMAVLTELEQREGSLPVTPTVGTGGGGRHYYFRHPDGEDFGNAVRFHDGLDLRGKGGMVVAPPSLHESGGGYTWLVDQGTPLAEVPDWLLRLIPTEAASERGAAQPPAAAPPGDGGGMLLTVVQTADDLTSHPGASDGERNGTLCRLIGIHLDRDDEPERISEMAKEWGRRCDPPLTDAEVREPFESLLAKQGRKAQSQARQQIPETSEFWPNLHEDAYQGLIGEIVQFIEPHTEADPVALLLSLLTFAGNAVGNSPYHFGGGDVHHVNLFTVLVGKSSKARKGVSEAWAMSLFDDDDPWKRGCLTAGLSSGEGLIWHLRDPIEELKAVQDKDGKTKYESVITDPGVLEKRLTLVETEFAQVLKVIKREGNTLSPVVRQAWDKGVLKTLTKNSSATATNTHISILAHITRQELERSLSDTERFNGFANRFLWALVRRSKLLPDGGADLDLSRYRRGLSGAIHKASEVGEMKRSPGARELWHGVYPELASEQTGAHGSVVARAEAQALRLSMLYALLDGESVIGVPHLRAALAVWRYCEGSARIIFGGGEGDPLSGRLLDAIEQRPGVSRTGLHKALGNRTSAQAMNEALSALRSEGVIRSESTPTGGKPSERWFPNTDLPHAYKGANQSHRGGSNQKQPTGLSLGDLIHAANSIGGELVRDGDRVIIKAELGKITPDMEAALGSLQPELRTLPFRAIPTIPEETNGSRPPADDELRTFLDEPSGIDKDMDDLFDDDPTGEPE